MSFLVIVPTNMLPMDDSVAKQTLRLLESLADHDDGQTVISNADFSDEVLAGYGQE